MSTRVPLLKNNPIEKVSPLLVFILHPWVASPKVSRVPVHMSRSTDTQLRETRVLHSTLVALLLLFYLEQVYHMA